MTRGSNGAVLDLGHNPFVERKLVTVVFADLVGSTALADEQDPERTRAVLDRFYVEMAAEVEAVDGTVEKFAGDAVMVQTDAARLEALAALGDHKRLEAEAERFRAAEYLEPFALRALGTVRSDERLLQKAATQFEAIGLDWHAAETRQLLAP